MTTMVMVKPWADGREARWWWRSACVGDGDGGKSTLSAVEDIHYILLPVSPYIHRSGDDGQELRCALIIVQQHVRTDGYSDHREHLPPTCTVAAEEVSVHTCTVHGCTRVVHEYLSVVILQSSSITMISGAAWRSLPARYISRAMINRRQPEPMPCGETEHGVTL
jgi:hypothetical protein